MYTLYSKRIKDAAGDSEVYVYDVFPQAFRNQMFYALSDVLDYYEQNGAPGAWEALHDNFAREIGVKNLGHQGYSDRSNVESYIEKSSDKDFLDMLDFSFAMVSKLRDIRVPYVSSEDQQGKITHAFVEMNFRFKQHSLGYEFVNDELIRKDNEFLHSETIKPALKLLYTVGFQGAEQEFLDAFEHRRKGENKDAILDALKAFESTMKAICNGMGYSYDPAKSTAKDLIGILESNGFYPTYMNNHMTSLRTSLESGLPTLRNKSAGHGQGAAVVNVSEEFTEYALNLAATNIVLLTKIYDTKKAGGA